MALAREDDEDPRLGRRQRDHADGVRAGSAPEPGRALTTKTRAVVGRVDPARDDRRRGLRLRPRGTGVFAAREHPRRRVHDAREPDPAGRPRAAPLGGDRPGARLPRPLPGPVDRGRSRRRSDGHRAGFNLYPVAFDSQGRATDYQVADHGAGGARRRSPDARRSGRTRRSRSGTTTSTTRARRPYVDRENEAIDRVADRFAQSLVTSLLEGF